MSPRTRRAPAPVATLISLGCSKNTVDSECLLGRFMTSGWLISEDPSDADVCLVNTCGFIDPARAETRDVLAEVSRLKKQGRLRAVVALGCLVERTAGMPEFDRFLEKADARVGFADYARLPEICRRLLAPSTIASPAHTAGVPHLPSGDFMRFLDSPRARIGSPHVAYLKISEGCSNFCRFCSIPLIRGRQVSRPMEEIVREAQSLADAGAREINLIAQDTTSYGRDLYAAPRLADLLLRLGAVGPSRWFRLLYAHPSHLGDDVLDALASSGHLCPYLDLPLQHVSDRILSAMGRGITRDRTLRLLDRIAERLPGGALRTTFIVGFPGETEAEFGEVLHLVREGRFMHMGVFAYSREPGTPAAGLDDDVEPAEKMRRRDELMAAQLEASRARLRGFVGRELEILVDGPVPEGVEAPRGVRAVGRTRLQAPEIDGVVLLRGAAWERVAPGSLERARAAGALDYDLIADHP